MTYDEIKARDGPRPSAEELINNSFDYIDDDHNDFIDKGASQFRI